MVLLGQLSGRPIVLVCVCTSVFLWTASQRTAPADIKALIFLVRYLNEDFIVWFWCTKMLGHIQKWKGQGVICQVV